MLGIDYIDTFSTTCRPETYRMVLIIGLHLNWDFLQYDVKNAFVHAKIDMDVYVKQPTGFEQGRNKTCKLNKALYGLKQSPRLWYKYFKEAVATAGFTIMEYDEGCFINKEYNVIHFTT